MSGTTTAIIGFAVMLLLIAIRMPVGLAMLLTGSLGVTENTTGMSDTMMTGVKSLSGSNPRLLKR